MCGSVGWACLQRVVGSNPFLTPTCVFVCVSKEKKTECMNRSISRELVFILVQARHRYIAVPSLNSENEDSVTEQLYANKLLFIKGKNRECFLIK